MKEIENKRFIVDSRFGFDTLTNAIEFAKLECQDFETNANGDKIFTPSIILDTRENKKHIVKFRPTKGFRVFVL
jgi:hypothetical protein